MAILDHVISTGISPFTATAICGGVTTLTAAGSTQATATLLGSGSGYISIVSSSGKGVQVPSCGIGSEIYIFNGGANSAHVYGQTGEAIGAGSANAAFVVATKKSVLLKKVSATAWGSILTA